ncbi:MAG: CHAD domain-containing protein [Prosthecobacter sp.]
MASAPSSLEPLLLHKIRSTLLSISRQAERDLELLPSDDVQRRIHTLRVRMKKLRAILRLLKPGLPPATLQAIRRRLRILKQAFSRNRDQHVLQSLAAEFQVKCSTHGIKLPSPQHGNRSADLPARMELLRLKATAHDLTHRLETLTIRPLDGHDIARAYASRYATALQGFRCSRKKPTPERLHRWRSPVKDHYLQSLLLLRDRRHLKLSRRLGSWLGQMHDLSLLHAHCRQHAPDAWVRTIRRRMKNLLARIFRKARRLFELSPSKFLRRVSASLLAGPPLRRPEPHHPFLL